MPAVLPGQPAVVLLGTDDLGRFADVVLAAVSGADWRPEPDGVGSAEVDFGRLPGDGELECFAVCGAAPADCPAQVSGCRVEAGLQFWQRAEQDMRGPAGRCGQGFHADRARMTRAGQVCLEISGPDLVGAGEPVKIGHAGLAGKRRDRAGQRGRRRERDAEWKHLRGAVTAGLGGVVDRDGVQQLAGDGLIAFENGELGCGAH